MTNYKLNEEKMFSDISDGIAVVINSETGIYYGFNEFGTEIFENLVNGVSTDNIITSLKKLKNTPEDIEKSFYDLVEKLKENEVIIDGEPSSEKAKLEQSIADNNKFVIDFNEYSDAQELLLADPIHDVKDETGWTPVLGSIEDDDNKKKLKKQKESDLIKQSKNKYE